MSAPKFGLDDAAIKRMASRMQPTPVQETASTTEHTMRFASFSQAQAGLAEQNFVSVGSAMYKRGHSLWQLNKASNGYSLVRVAAEPAVFEEDEVHEAPGLHSEEQLKMGSRDRCGVSVLPGDVVHYSLGGEPVLGRVVRAAYGYLDVQLRGQMDSGVPSDMTMVDRHRRRAGCGEDPSIDIVRDSPEHKTDAKDKDMMGMSINPEKVASFIGQHFGSFGAGLADYVDVPLPRETIVKMNELAKRAASCTCRGIGCVTCMGRQCTRTPSWGSLRKFARHDVIKGVRRNVNAGIRSRRVSKALNIPFSLAYELRDDIALMPMREARAIFETVKEVRTASSGDSAFASLAGKVGPEFAQHLASSVAAYRQQQLPFQRQAVDQTAADYWKAYFGEYGDQWVREIKRRVKADLVREALVKQGVDQTAADYWSNYFGDYGEMLVGEVDRASKKETVTARHRPLNADSQPMPLPRPMQSRDIFAGANILADESWGNNRVAIAKTASGGFQVLVRSGNTQRVTTQPSQQEAISEFRKAVYAHCGI